MASSREVEQDTKAGLRRFILIMMIMPTTSMVTMATSTTTIAITTINRFAV